MNHRSKPVVASLGSIACSLVLSGQPSALADPQVAAKDQQPVPQSSPRELGHGLRHLAPSRVVIGTALGPGDISDPVRAELIAREFGALTCGNDMKPDALQREKGVFTFQTADRFVDFAQQHDMKVIGHTLVWHSQAPKWLFEDSEGKPLSREEALENLRNHIQTVVRHFKGRIVGWDVVNEAISDSPNEYLRNTPALRAIGEDYIVKAFEFAREADPDVELYYNDYNIESDYKRPKAMRLIRELLDAGVKVSAIGVQGHWLLGHPSLEEIERGLRELSTLNLPIHITELDVDPLPRSGSGGADVTATERAGMDPYRDGFPPEMQQQLADRYESIFKLLLSFPNVTRITFWGYDDGTTWLNYFPVRGRVNHPLIFDRQLQPKPAYHAVAEVLRAAPR